MISPDGLRYHAFVSLSALARCAALRITLVVCAVVAFVFFTSVYRNSRAFSAADGVRCSALSGEHRSAEQQFDGTIVRLAADLAIRVPSILDAVVDTEDAGRPLPVQQVALCRCLRHRPPPVALA